MKLASGPSTDVALADLPREARDTYALIHKGGPFPYERDGVTFGNRERILPAKPREVDGLGNLVAEVCLGELLRAIDEGPERREIARGHRRRRRWDDGVRLVGELRDASRPLVAPSRVVGVLRDPRHQAVAPPPDRSTRNPELAQRSPGPVHGP